MALETAFDFTKDPDDDLNYSFDWSRWLAGDTITGLEIIATSGITVESSTFTGTSSTVYLSGGTEGRPYDVTHRITTVNGLVKNLTMKFRVQSK